jgi:hypothetical protein
MSEVNADDLLAFLRWLRPDGPWVLDTCKEPRANAAFGPHQEDDLRAFVARHAGRDTYLLIGLPAEGVAGQPKKTQMCGAEVLWVDLDPRAGEDLSRERERMLALLTTARPAALPPPSVIVDSGRGFWAFWRLAEPLHDTALAERLNRAIALQFPGDFSDSCHNINRVARAPGTINRKTGATAQVRWDLSAPDTAYMLDRLPSPAPADAQAEAIGDAARDATAALDRLTVDGAQRLTLEDLTRRGVPDRIVAIVNHGRIPDEPKRGDDSRSAWLFDVTCNLLRAGLTPEEVFGIITDREHTISHSVFRQKDGKRVPTPAKYARKQVTKALAEVARGGDAPPKARNPTAPSPDAIDVSNVHLRELVGQVAALLRDRSGRVFRRDGHLVRIETLQEAVREGGVVRHPGAVAIRTATPGWLAIEASAIGAFMAPRGKAMVPVAPSEALMARLGHAVDETGLPELVGVSMTPTLTCDRPGYDAGKKLLLAFPPDMFPPAPPAPDRRAAEAALDRLRRPLRAFPFATPVSRAVALSAMLSGVVRGEMETCPLHAIDAPTPGTGKTKLAEIIGLLATGATPSGLSFSADREEMEKRLVGVLRVGDPVLLIDNISAPLEGDLLCQMMTSATVRARVLGSSDVIQMQARTLVVATGNNIAVRGDMVRRTVMCRLDAQMQNPEHRHFDFDAVQEVRAARPQLVVDALTVLRAYMAAGEPDRPQALGSFEDWSLIRGALIWLGEADPAESRESVAASDDTLEQRFEVLDALLACFPVRLGDRTTTFLVKEIDERSAHDMLRNRLAAHLPRGEWSKVSAGLLLKRHLDVPHMDHVLRASKATNRPKTWWIEKGKDGARWPEQRGGDGGMAQLGAQA